jgi:hypothetical protein
MKLVKLGVSKVEARERAELATKLPALVAIIFDIKEWNHLVWYLGKSEIRIKIVRAEEGVPEDKGILGLLG